MPDFIRFLATLREQMSAELTRSDVLRALIWPNSGLLVALIAAVTAKAPNWIQIMLAIMLCIFMTLYGGAYIYFAATDPDALRSEKYKLHKMAIEHGIIGDNMTGIIDANPQKLISAPATTAEKIEQ